MRVRMKWAALVALTALAVPAAASAHAEIQPSTVPGGDLANLTVSVPNEQEDAATTSVSIQIPEQVLLVRFAPKPGWKRTESTEKLAQASTVGDDTVTERVTAVTWAGRIEPGEFDTFQLSIAVPDDPGAELVFPTVQRYDNGDVVRWIGAENSEEPAPRVTVAAAGDAHGATTTGTTAATTANAAEDGSHGSDAKSNTALGLAIAGLAAGLVALGVCLARRRGGSGSH